MLALAEEICIHFRFELGGVSLISEGPSYTNFTVCLVMLIHLL